MANDKNDDLSGRDLQSSQAGGAGGGYDGSNRDQRQAQPEGGGPTAADLSQAGGSSGTGGYGSSQNVVNQRDRQPGQGSQSGLAGGDLSARGAAAGGQSRGERFDEEQGGGRGVMFDGAGGVSDPGEDGESAGASADDFNREV